MLDSALVKSLPCDAQSSIQKFFAQRVSHPELHARLHKFRRRDIKAGWKEREAESLLAASLDVTSVEKTRPKVVSDLTGVSLEQVHRIKKRMVARLKYQPKRQTPQYRQRKQELLARTRQAIEKMGLPNMTTSRLHAQLKAGAAQDLARCPSVSTVRQMLREDFQLRYRVANAAKIKYNDVSFDDKRVWVSRLLAQFLLSGVVIVSIDESSFK